MCPGEFSHWLITCRIGRKLLFMGGSVQMMIAFVAVAAIMGKGFNKRTGHINSHLALAIIVLECAFTWGFAYSWGPLGWLVSHAPLSRHCQLFS